jgi:DNA-binding transcriptional LysR family regulator
MEISSLRVIQILAHDPNLTRAAERLHLSQSALSKRVHAIEEELGVELFERRGPRGLRPYPQAIELAGLADRILTTWDTGVRRIQTLTEEPDHFVLVGPQLFLREVVLPWWQTVADQFSGLTLEVRVSSLARVSLETVEAGADAGILEHREELGDYICKSIYHERWGVVRHPQSQPGQYKKYIWGTVSTQDNPVDTWLVKTQKMPPPIYRVYWQDLTALGLWVSETPGAATVLPWHAVAWLARKNLVAFDPIGADATTHLYLAFRKNSPHKRLLKALSALGKAESRLVDPKA